MRGTKIRSVLYFCSYLVIGPLMGYLAAIAMNLGVNWVSGGFVLNMDLGMEFLADLIDMWAIPYLLGIVPAGITGYFAAKSLYTNGHSVLLNNLKVAVISSAGLLLLFALAFGFGLLVAGLVFVPAALFATSSLFLVERLFRLNGEV